MTDAEIKEVKIGDNIRVYLKPLEPLDLEVAQVLERGVCKAEHARGAAWVYVRAASGVRVILESDELHNFYATIDGLQRKH